MGSSRRSAKYLPAGTVAQSPFSSFDVKHMWKRSLAWLVDSLIIAAAGALLFHLTSTQLVPFYLDAHDHVIYRTYPTWEQYAKQLPLFYGAGLAILMAYYISLEWVFGATVGKAIFGLRVVDFEGGPMTFYQALMRNLMRIIDAFPAGLNGIGGVTALSNQRRQRWGDKEAGTMVVSTMALRRTHEEQASDEALVSRFLTIRQA